MSLTQKDVQDRLINQATQNVFNTINRQAAVQNAVSSGGGFMQQTFDNGYYDSSGNWINYLLCDITNISDGVLA